MSTSQKRVLVVEDDPKASELVKLYLQRDGFSVTAAFDGLDGLNKAREEKPDLVVLDLMLPKLDGLEVCRTLRQESGVPIVMLTARTTEQDVLRGLGLGADDYVTKPFSPRELVARVKAVLRRTAEESLYRGPLNVTFGELRIDYAKHRVTVGGRDVHLTPTEFRLLAALAREPGRVFSRSQLIQKVLGYDFEGSERTVDVHVLNLRRKIEPDGASTRYIKSVYGMGYKLGA